MTPAILAAISRAGTRRARRPATRPDKKDQRRAGHSARKSYQLLPQHVFLVRQEEHRQEMPVPPALVGGYSTQARSRIPAMAITVSTAMRRKRRGATCPLFSPMAPSDGDEQAALAPSVAIQPIWDSQASSGQ